MNKTIGKIGALVNMAAVGGFALSMLLGSPFASYITSIFIALGFIPMICAFAASASQERKAAGATAMVFAGVYGVLILLVYFAQVTSVRLDSLTEQAKTLLDYQYFSLFFSYDLLGYGMMALATFFAGLTLEGTAAPKKWLKALLMIHGIFFLPCLLMPMLGVFSPDMVGADWIGTALLEFWCLYFLPVGALSYWHFAKA